MDGGHGAERGIRADRVVAVVARLATGKLQVGSGYLVAERLVLTAEHCIRDKGAAAGSEESPVSLKVLRLSDYAEASAVVASHDGHPAASRALDLALLEIADKRWSAVPRISVGRVDRSASGELDPCETVGFPLWQLDPKDSTRNPVQVRGPIRTLDDFGVIPERLVLRDPVLHTVHLKPAALVTEAMSQDDAKTTTRSPWGGVSGALVFYGDFAIGVVVEHNPQQGDTSLRIRPLDILTTAQDSPAAAIARQLDLPDRNELPIVLGANKYASPRVMGERVVGERVSAVADFRDHVKFYDKLRDLVLAREKPIICVTGRRGIGKSGLVAKVLADFEEPAEGADDRVGGLAYLSTRTDVGVIDLARIFHALAELLPQDQRDLLEKQWTNARTDVLPDLLAALRARNAVLVLDDLDRLQDRETGELTSDDLVTFLTAVCRDPQPPVIVTTSQHPIEFPLEILGRFTPLEIDDGLEVDDAVGLLRQLDAYDRLRDLPGAELRQAVERVYRMPRGIQLFVQLLGRKRGTATLRRLLDAKDPPEAVIEQLVEEGFHSLDEVERDVVSLLALADTPMPVDALPEMLADEHPPDTVARTVERLDETQMIDIDPSNDRARLHPIDSDYVRGVLLADQGKRAALDLRLADWLATQRTDPRTWRTSADVGPQRREIRHRLRAGDGHGAVRVMANIADFLARHGDGDQLTDVLEQGLRYADTPAARAAYELSRGTVEFYVGSLDETIAAYGAGRDAAEEAGDHILTAQLDSWLGVALRHAGDAAAALEPLKRASRLPMSDQVSREIVMGSVFHCGIAACYLGDIAEAEEAVARTEEMLREDDPSLWWAHLADLRTLVALLQGDYTRVLAEVEQGIVSYVNSPNQDNIGYLINVRGLVLLAQGRTDEAASEFTTVREEAAALRYARLEGFAALNLAWAQLSEGNRLAAAATAREAADLLAANRVREAESAQALTAAAEAGEVDAMRQGLRLAVSASQGNPDLYQPSDQVLADLAAGLSRP
jgi:tetratricopeptide (TPR) repeat protein